MEASLASYRVCVERRLVPHLGGLRLAALEPADVRRTLAALAAAGLSPRSRELTRVALSQALGQAVRDGLLPRNVCDAVDPPKVPRREARALTAAEISRLLAYATGDWHALWLLALHTGMREGELLGLTWHDVARGAPFGAQDDSGGVVTVQRALVDGEDGLPVLRDAPKSRAGSAPIPSAGRWRWPRGAPGAQDAERAVASRWPRCGWLVFLSRGARRLLRANVGRIFQSTAKGGDRRRGGAAPRAPPTRPTCWPRSAAAGGGPPAGPRQSGITLALYALHPGVGRRGPGRPGPGLRRSRPEHSLSHH